MPCFFNYRSGRKGGGSVMRGIVLSNCHLRLVFWWLFVVVEMVLLGYRQCGPGFPSLGFLGMVIHLVLVLRFSPLFSGVIYAAEGIF